VEPLDPGVLALSLMFDGSRSTSSHVEECPDTGPACAGPNPPPPYNHDLVNWTYGATLDAQYGVLRYLTVAASLPLRAITTRVQYTDLSGAPYTPNPPDVHHKDRTLVGLGDPSVVAVFGRRFDRLSFAIRGGALLPFGQTLDADPFVLGREGIPHEHVQFGVGIVRPLVASALGLDLGKLGFDAGFDVWSVAILSVATNSIGYRPGQRFVSGARVSYWFFGVGAEVSHESTETWSGLQAEEGNLGRTDVVALLTARTPIGRGFSAFGALRVPLYVHAVGAQLSYPAYLQVGIATAIGP
jgi:hypothetical protein